MTILPNFYCVEGIDGSGKTSVVSELQKLDPSIVTGFEPTKGQYGVQIREILAGKVQISNTELLDLFIKDREENQIWIKSEVEKGNTVVLDRYILSTMAYQGLNFELDKLYNLNAYFFKPSVIFFLDVPPSIALERKMEQLNAVHATVEKFETLEQQEKIYTNYLKSIEILGKNGYSIIKLDKENTIKNSVDEIYNEITRDVIR